MRVVEVVRVFGVSSIRQEVLLFPGFQRQLHMIKPVTGSSSLVGPIALSPCLQMCGYCQMLTDLVDRPLGPSFRPTASQILAAGINQLLIMIQPQTS